MNRQRNDHWRRVAAAAEIVVVGFDRLADIAQAIGRDDELQVVVGHVRVLMLLALGRGNRGMVQ